VIAEISVSAERVEFFVRRAHRFAGRPDEGALEMTTVNAPAPTSHDDHGSVASIGPEHTGKPFPKKLAGAVFVLFWLAALALWIIAPHIADPRWGAFVIDTGILLASVGFAAPGISRIKSFGVTLGFAALAWGLFALGDFFDILALSYFLRMFVPLLALLGSLYGLIGKLKVWY
jgi:hypothetical protein